MRWWDLEAVASLESSVFAGEQPWSTEQLWAELAGAAQRRHYVVALGGERVVGYAGTALTPDSADVMTVVVDPSWRGRGIGRRLVTLLLDHAAERGAREVLLEVRADNVQAIALYLDLGFTEISRRRGYYGVGTDGVVMRRRAQWARS